MPGSTDFVSVLVFFTVTSTLMNLFPAAGASLNWLAAATAAVASKLTLL